MRRVRTTPRAWVFALTNRERDFLCAVLQAYPAVPKGYSSLSRESVDRLNPEDEELLLEAMNEHRDRNRIKVRRWLNRGERFKLVEGEWLFRLAKTDFDWLLQVLNDVRVGYWIQLGSPDDIHDPVELLHKDPTSFFHMEAAGMFQMELLHAVQEAPDPG